MILRGKCVVPGHAIGEIIVSLDPISFLGDIDPNTGIIIAKDHSLKDKSISGKIFAFPYGKGSTVGSYVIYQLFKNEHAPLAIINQKAEAIVAVGAIISNIPMIQDIDINKIPQNGMIEVLADEGIVKF